MTKNEKIPAGRLGRLARMTAVGARAGMSALLRNDGGATAQQASEVLGTLRGLAAKMGQMASYVDGLVPEGQSAAYEHAMKGLRAATPTTPFAEARRVIEAELGAPLSTLFASFEEVPRASASLGQVHRATLPDGTVVAVKVQHPGVDKAVESDLANAAILEAMAALGGARKMQSKAMLAEVRKRFMEELDYRLEADHQSNFARFHEGDPQIRIPPVFRSHSSRRVLTTAFVEGESFDYACAAPENERRAWCETLWRFVFKGNLVFGQFNADPHPGNYLFHADGVITFLDFGCIQPIPEARRPRAHAVHHAALHGDEAAFRRAVAGLLETTPGPYEDGACTYSRGCFEPIFASPFRVTRAYTTSLVEGIRELSKIAKKHLPPNAAPFPAELIFLNRLQFGFYSVLARLDAEVDYRAVERTFV